MIMKRELSEARKGRRIWRRIKREYSIDYSKVVLVLPETDAEWNRQALMFLPELIKRKSAEKALVISPWDDVFEEVRKKSKGNGFVQDGDAEPGQCLALKLSEDEIDSLLKYYCFYKFFDSIIFLYKDKPKDNPGTLILSQGCVSKKELICLGHYNLREVPDNV